MALSGCSDSKPAESASPSAATSPTSAAPSESPSATPTQPAKVADNLDDIHVEGKPGEKPAVSVPTPWAIKDTQAKVLDPAPEGAQKVASGDTVIVHYAGVDGRTGETFDESYTKGAGPATFPLSGVVQGFKKGLEGQSVGSRVLIAMTGADGYDSQGGSPQAGIQVGDTLIFVVDIVGVQLREPAGDAQPQDAALPQVSEGTGKPTLTIPQGYAAPAETVAKTIIAGKGEKVAEGDVVTVNYQVTSLKSGKVLEETYGEAPQQGALSGLIPCWSQGLVDKTVGSRVLLVCPPATAYPEGNATPKIESGDTLIYVVDLLNHAAAPKK